MARARNIKPGFFTNDVLAECDPLTRILFAGLWTIADREGRLEDRPKKIKAEILPYDNCDVDEMLNILQGKSFILRYTVGDKSFIQIEQFSKHQNPHVKEAESTIPAPGKNGASAGKAGASRADSLNPITDSLNPIKAPVPDGTLDCPHDEIIAAYHELLPACPRVRAWTDKRRSALRSRWREGAKEYQTVEDGVAWWRRFFGYVGQSDFLTGKAQSNGRAPFLADLEWLTNSSNFVKVIEGKYHA